MNLKTINIGNDVYAEQLNLLLNESPDQAVQRERIAFDLAAGSYGQRIVLFGAGGFGKLILAKMLSIGLKPLAFADNNSALWETTINGIPVYSPSKAA